MIAQLVDILKGAIGLPVQTKYGIAQIIEGVPSVHVGNGQWKPIAIDSDGAWSYFRIIGQTQVQSADIGEPCAGIGMTMTLRYVALLERSACGELPDALVGVTGDIRGSSRAIRTAIGATKVDFTSIRFGIDEVAKQEFSKEPKIPLQRVLVNLDMTVYITGNESCLTTC